MVETVFLRYTVEFNSPRASLPRRTGLDERRAGGCVNFVITLRVSGAFMAGLARQTISNKSGGRKLHGRGASIVRGFSDAIDEGTLWRRVIGGGFRLRRI